MRLVVAKALVLSVCVVSVPLVVYAQGFLSQSAPAPKPWMPTTEAPTAPQTSPLLRGEAPTNMPLAPFAQSLKAPAPQDKITQEKAAPSPVSYQQTIPQLPVQTQETDGPLSVYVDRAEVLPLPKNIASLVIGNPLIADASIHPGGFMVITPKGLGTTNLIMLDGKGQTIAYRLIRVKTVNEQTVRVFRGIERETYNCAPHCDKTQTLGDNNPYFDAAMGQSTSRATTLSGVARQ
jgi:hypothetical protein